MKKFLSGAVIGAAIAGVVVALTTPKKGSELREDIKDEATKIKHHGEDMVEKAQEKAVETYEKAHDMATETYEKAVVTATELKDKVTHKDEDLVIEEVEEDT